MTGDSAGTAAAVIEFARRELADDLSRRDAAETFSRRAWESCAAFGIQGLPVPKEFGGQAANAVTIATVMRALGYACRDNGLLFSLGAHMWSAAVPIARYGTPEQKRRHLPGMCDGSLIGVQAMTEPGSGSDAYSLSSRAEPVGNDFVLNGVKRYITNAPVADVFVIFASTDPAKRRAGVTAFVVERGTPGLGVGPNVHKMGLRTAPMAELVLRDCVVPASAVLGRVGTGAVVFEYAMKWERAMILAGGVGTMRRHLEDCLAYAGDRVQFGRTIDGFQAVSHRLADMKVRLDTATALLERIARALDDGEATAADASVAKLYLSEALVQSAMDAMQIHGAHGFMTESGIERDVRDALAGRIYSGTSDMQREVIARDLRIRRKPL